MCRAALFICRDTRLSANGGRVHRLVQRRGEMSDGRVQNAAAHELLSLSFAPDGTAWPRCSGVSDSSASKIPSARLGSVEVRPIMEFGQP